MSRFRSKPVEIEAVQLDRNMTEPGWMVAEWDAKRMWTETDDAGMWHWHVETANGPVFGHEGDWLIREPSGVGAYPCKPEVFALKYEPVDQMTIGQAEAALRRLSMGGEI